MDISRAPRRCTRVERSTDLHPKYGTKQSTPTASHAPPIRTTCTFKAFLHIACNRMAEQVAGRHGPVRALLLPHSSAFGACGRAPRHPHRAASHQHHVPTMPSFAPCKPLTQRPAPPSASSGSCPPQPQSCPARPPCLSPPSSASSSAPAPPLPAAPPAPPAPTTPAPAPCRAGASRACRNVCGC